MKTTITQNQIFRSFSRLQRSCFSAVFLLLFLLSASSSWGQVTFRSSNTSTTITSNVMTITKPSGVVSRDLLIAVFQTFKNPSSQVVPPAGWSTLYSGQNGGSSKRLFSVFYKIANSSEPTSYAFGSSNDRTAGAIVAYYGVDIVNPFDVISATYTTADASSISVPEITTISNKTKVLLLGASSGNNTATNNFTNNFSSGTERIDIGAANSGDGAAVLVFERDQPTAGTTGSVTITGPARLAGALVALRPGGSAIFETSSTFNVPCYVTNVAVEAWGGGGGAGSRDGKRPGGGGGGGAYAKKNLLTVTPNSSITATVGVGGTGASDANSNTATDGGHSSFGTLIANGGSKGSARTGGIGGSIGTSGDINYAGGGGGTSLDTNDNGGAGGGAAGNTTGTGAAGSANSGGTGGAGGVGVSGAGSGGAGGNNDVNGNPGIAPGGGGGGEGGDGTSNADVAGNGGAGRVHVSWPCPSATIEYSAASFCKSVTSAAVTITGTDARSTCSTTFSSTTGLSINTTTGAINPSASTVGTYTVTYALPEAGGCAAVSATATVTINALPTATWASTATAVCYSSSAQTTSLAYSATTASPTSYSITWSATTPANSFAAVSNQAFDGTAAGGTISIAIPAGTDPGTYTGTITVKNANSCTSSAVQTFTVTVNAPSLATATSTNTCGVATLTAVADTSATVKWFSDNTGNQEVTSTPVNSYTRSISFTDPTTATSYYAYTYDANGCRSVNYREAVVELKYTNTYTSTGNDWFTAGNWTCGIPTANSNVVIPADKTVSIAYIPNRGPAYANTVSLQGNARLTVTTDHGIVVTDKIDVASGATFTLENGASLVQVNPVIANVGSIKVKKATANLGLDDCVFWSSPVQNVAMSTFAPNSNNFYWTFNSAVVNNSNSSSASYSWVGVAADAPFETGKGYYIKSPNTQQTNTPWTTEFNGTPNNGNIELVYPVTGDITERYYFVGNPYPSAISIDKFMRDNAAYINETIYLFREPNGNSGTGYSTVSRNPTNNANTDFFRNNYGIDPQGVIPSGQGFLVRLRPNPTAYKVVFNNGMRVTNNHRFFNRSAQNNEDAYNLKLTAANARFSQAKVGYYENALNEEEASFDVRSMDDGAFDLGTLLNQKNFKVQARAAYNAADVVYLRFKTNVAGEHRISLSDTNGVFATDQMVIIKDNLTGVQHNLTANGDYVFTSATGTFTNRFEVIYQQAYYTALQANSCGATIANMSSLVYADIVNGATGYRFKVVNNTTAAVQTIDRPQHWFAFNMLSAYDYNTPYTISVQVQKDGVWTGYYGATCTVNSPNIAATGVMQINPSQCGMTLPTIGTVIATTPVAGATGYKFRITNTTAGAMGNNLVQEVTRTNHWFTLAMLARYNYGSSYAIEVAVKTTAGYTPYGNACTVYAPGVPTLASCGQTVATSTTLVRTTATTLATQYRFQVTRIATQETITFDTANYWFSFRVNVPGYAAGEQYGVRVAVMTAGAWSPYGDACDITAPIATARTTEEAAPSEANLFKPVAYPNPFASTFGISLATPSADVVHVMVYDLQGRLIEKQNVFVSQLDSLQIGTNYPSGDYLLVVAQGANIKSSHIHKD